MNEFDNLLTAARGALSAAYAPYSHFRVGAAVRAPSGAIYSGCNVENAAFPVGLCAEAGAIAAMVAAGERRISDILVMGEGAAPITPCGACRQRIAEFADSATRVLVADASGVRSSYRFEDLLPHSFGSQNLGDSYSEASDV